jgi:aminoglycoside 3-N-acetyltransferase
MAQIFTTEEIECSYRDLGITAGDVVYLTGNFGALGLHESKSKEGTIKAHFEALKRVVGAEGTIIVPTHSFYLCNTSTPFDLQTSRGKSGAFTEFVRQQAGAVRQLHPFASLTAHGARSAEICEGTTRHAYGPNTPYARLLEMDAWGVSVGMPPPRTCSLIHHIEQMMAVPYRYTKEFIHPVVRHGEVALEPFYLFVTYRDCDLVRDRNEKLFKDDELSAACVSAKVGIGQISGYRMQILERVAVRLMSEDPYHWLSSPPTVRPYQR